MPTDARVELSPTQIQGIKYIQRVLPLLERLRPSGCERDKAGNRRLFYDQYCALLLIYFFNANISSLRALQRASKLESVFQKVGARRVSIGSLSEAASVFDPERLAEIVAELGENLPAAASADLPGVKGAPTVVDGTLLKALPQITQASFLSQRHRGWRLHTHFEVLRGIPVNVTLTDAKNSKASNEKGVLRSTLNPDRCYILDRGYEEFGLFNAIVAKGSSYVCRIRADHHFTAEETRPLSAAALEAGVCEDAVGRLGSPKSKRIEHPNHRVRRLVARVPVHAKRKKSPAAYYELVIVTNLLDAPAEVVATLYRWRWLIELFFRFFKQMLGCKQLLSQRHNGILIQVYCALIACLLLHTAYGQKPNKATFEMFCFYFQGWATEEELLRHLEKQRAKNG
jgi:hypothetical protein